MSAPYGPQGANRGGGRGRLRGGLHPKGGGENLLWMGHVYRGRLIGKVATSPRAGSQVRKSKPVAQENGLHNNTRRNNPVSTISKHLNGIKNPSPLSRVITNSPEKQSWRDPTAAENGDYKDRMQELWTTVRK